MLERDLNSISLAQGRFHDYESEEVIVEHVKVVNGIPRSVGLMPEVDDVGNIEYKMKLPRPTSLHRLERLRTQCKWRLVQGGGKAVYELGVLDNGVLIGLSKGEMKESLETLGRMLSGLGGGRVKITRVMRLGNDEIGTKDEEETGFESFEVEADETDSTFIPYIPPTLIDESTLTVTLPLSTTTTTTTTQPIDIDTLPNSNSKGPTPFPSNRTPAEQAELKRSKRDARRHRRNEVDSPHPRNPALPNSHFVHSHPHCVHQKPHAHPHSHPQPHAHPHTHLYPEPKRTPFNSHPGPIPPRQKAPRPPKPPRRNKLREREEKQRAQQQRDLSLLETGREGVGMKPVIKMGEGEVRWVVEALVEKRGGTNGARRESVVKRKGSDSSDSVEGGGRGRLRDRGEEILTFGEEEEECALVSDQSHTSTEEGLSVDEEEEEEDEEGCEGWNFLSFDLKELSASVKASAAAASSL